MVEVASTIASGGEARDRRRTKLMREKEKRAGTALANTTERAKLYDLTPQRCSVEVSPSWEVKPWNRKNDVDSERWRLGENVDEESSLTLKDEREAWNEWQDSKEVDQSRRKEVEEVEIEVEEEIEEEQEEEQEEEDDDEEEEENQKEKFGKGNKVKAGIEGLVEEKQVKEDGEEGDEEEEQVREGVLDLSANRSLDFRHLSVLQPLDLPSSVISEVCLSSVSKLVLRNVGLTRLGELDVVLMPSLRQLDLSYNKITSMSMEKHLLLSSPVSTPTSSPKKATPAKYDERKERKKKIREALSKWQNLEEVDLSHNEITKMEPLYFFKTLRKLNISYNKVRMISGLHILPRLSHLDLSHNKLSSTLSIRELSLNQALSSLSLRGNALAEQSTSIKAMMKTLVPQLQNLDGEDLYPPPQTSNTSFRLLKTKCRSKDQIRYEDDDSLCVIEHRRCSGSCSTECDPQCCRDRDRSRRVRKAREEKEAERHRSKEIRDGESLSFMAWTTSARYKLGPKEKGRHSHRRQRDQMEKPQTQQTPAQPGRDLKRDVPRIEQLLRRLRKQDKVAGRHPPLQDLLASDEKKKVAKERRRPRTENFVGSYSTCGDRAGIEEGGDTKHLLRWSRYDRERGKKSDDVISRAEVGDVKDLTTQTHVKERNTRASKKSGITRKRTSGKTSQDTVTINACHTLGSTNRTAMSHPSEERGNSICRSDGKSDVPEDISVASVTFEQCGDVALTRACSRSLFATKGASDADLTSDQAERCTYIRDFECRSNTVSKGSNNKVKCKDKGMHCLPARPDLSVQTSSVCQSYQNHSETFINTEVNVQKLSASKASGVCRNELESKERTGPHGSNEVPGIAGVEEQESHCSHHDLGVQDSISARYTSEEFPFAGADSGAAPALKTQVDVEERSCRDLRHQPVHSLNLDRELTQYWTRKAALDEWNTVSPSSPRRIFAMGCSDASRTRQGITQVLRGFRRPAEGGVYRKIICADPVDWVLDTYRRRDLQVEEPISKDICDSLVRRHQENIRAAWVICVPSREDLQVTVAKWRHQTFFMLQAMLRKISLGDKAFVYIEDCEVLRKTSGETSMLEFVDGSHLCQSAADSSPCKLLWKIMLQRPVAELACDNLSSAVLPPDVISSPRSSMTDCEEKIEVGHLLCFGNMAESLVAMDVPRTGSEVQIEPEEESVSKPARKTSNSRLGLLGLSLILQEINDGEQANKGRETTPTVVILPYCGRGQILGLANSLGYSCLGIDADIDSCRAALGAMEPPECERLPTSTFADKSLL